MIKNTEMLSVKFKGIITPNLVENTMGNVDMGFQNCPADEPFWPNHYLSLSMQVTLRHKKQRNNVKDKMN